MPIEYLSENTPKIIEDLCSTKAMSRLKGVGMHCGLEYTSFPFFRDLKPYSRFDHSLGVAKIIYRFTKDSKQAVSGLFHDISTPTFAHVIDFLQGDYDKQESTEKKTSDVIRSSKEIMDILHGSGIKLEEVDDYHKYPVADNDSPKLSADRLEYSLSNFMNFGLLGKEVVQKIYDDIEVGINEFGEEELVFATFDLAKEFGFNVLENSKIYISDPDRYSMEFLAKILRDVINKGIVTIDDLYVLNEEELIGIMKGNDESYNEFIRFKRMGSIKKSQEPINSYSVKISAKIRYIDPYIKGIGRLSKANDEFRKEIKKLIGTKFDYYLTLDE